MSSTVIERTVEKLITGDQAQELQRMTEFRLSDAMRLGSSVSEQAYNWSNGEALCALSAAVCAAKATGWLEA